MSFPGCSGFLYLRLLASHNLKLYSRKREKVRIAGDLRLVGVFFKGTLLSPATDFCPVTKRENKVNPFHFDKTSPYLIVI